MKDIEISDPAKTAQKWIDFLKAGKDTSGVPDVIIALTHIPSYQDGPDAPITGKEINHLCKNTKELDAVISGHSHNEVCGKINDVPVVQALYNGRALGILKFTLTENNELRKTIPSIINIYKNKHKLAKDAKISAILNKYLLQAKKLDKPIGRLHHDLNDTTNKNGISEIGAWATKAIWEKTNAQVSVLNRRALRSKLNSGSIAISDIYKLSPFFNSVITMKLPGKSLKRVIEHSLGGIGEFYGLKVHYDSKAAKGKQVVSMSLLNGETINMNRFYTVSTLDFAYNGGDKFDFTGAEKIKDTRETLRDMLITIIKEKKVIHRVETDYLIPSLAD